MIGYDRESEIKLEEYLVYLCRLAEKRFCDCQDIDMLVQDTLAVLVLKLDRGEEVKHPKAFLSAVLKNKYNAWLRERYKNELLEYTDDTVCESRDDIADPDQAELQRDEYEAVRREIGRLVRIYREVTVLHYVHGRSVEEISRELGIPRGTVLSRLSSARDQIREGL